MQPVLPSKCEHLHWITVYNSRRRRRAAGRRHAGRIVRRELTCQFTAYNTIVLFLFLAAWRNSDTPTSGKKSHFSIYERRPVTTQYAKDALPAWAPPWTPLGDLTTPPLSSRLGRGIPPHHTPCHASILTLAKMLCIFSLKWSTSKNNSSSILIW